MQNYTEKLIEKQRQTFGEIIYCLTEPNIPKHILVTRIERIRKRMNEFLQALINIKKEVASEEDRDKITLFMKECIQRYQEELEKVTVSSSSSNEEYAAEAGTEATRSTIVPKELINKDKSIYDRDNSNKKEFSTMTATEIDKIKTKGTPNVSWEVTIKDGETIPATQAELFYVINPITSEGSILITRFSTQDELTKHIEKEYSSSRIEPFIIHGKQAALTRAINIKI